MRKQKKMSAGGFLALTVILTMLLCGYYGNFFPDRTEYSR